MARAGAASASARPDSIKGLAQAIAKPAYRRLLTAEPALRRAVPALIIAFLLTIGVGAVVQVLDHRRQAIIDTGNDLRTIADVVAERLDRVAGERANQAGRRQESLERALLTGSTAFGRRILVTNTDGKIIAAVPDSRMRGINLLDLLGDAEALTILGASAGVVEIALADGTIAF